LDPYPGLPKGAFDEDKLPRQAATALGTVDEGVWTAAVDTYVTVINPDTGKPDLDRPLENAAASAVRNAASACYALALDYSARSDDRAGQQEVEAAKHITEAVDLIEHANSIMSEEVIGPDDDSISGWDLRHLHSQDQELARARSTAGDPRHTQTSWARSWRLIAASLLGVLDAILLWKPLLNLSFDGDPNNLFRWSIGVGMVGLQVLVIEWSARAFVTAERASVDRRGSAGDYNRLFSGGRLGSDRPAPTNSEITEADQEHSRAYYVLVGVSAAVAVIGGVRVAWLGRQADLPLFEAALFGTVIGLVLGCLVVLMARLYCRGNLLGDRLHTEREALERVYRRFKNAQDRVSDERDSVMRALGNAKNQAKNAESIRTRTLVDYKRAVGLAWAWFGLPPDALDEAGFTARAEPKVADTAARRTDLETRLTPVNSWLSDRTPKRPTAAARPAITGAKAETSTRAVRRDPHAKSVQLRHRREPIQIPVQPKPPHKWMLAAAVATLVATITTAAFAPAADLAPSDTPDSTISIDR
jgi:hypothetical protein